ncbi:MAG: PcfJ domain-containing protein [Pirellulaceae bacterium]|nr:PcfJ domain-containing protein [Pirellulaceae bacterium]
MTVKSKYRFTQYPDGFKVEAPDRVPVRVTLFPTGFRIDSLEAAPREPRQLMLFPELQEVEPELKLNLVQYPRLVETVADASMSNWSPPKPGIPFRGVRIWAKKKTARALGKRIHRQWQRLVAKIDPLVWRVQKAVYAAAPCLSTPLLHVPELYQHPYLVSDILRYRAAAIAVNIGDTLCQWRRARQHEAALPQPGGLAIMPLDIEYRYSVRPEFAVQQMAADWQRLYSSTEVAYGSLRRTLMQLPGGISIWPHTVLPIVHLVRPMTDRLELATLLRAVMIQRERLIDEGASHLRTFHYARRSEIREAMDLVAAELAMPLSHRRNDAIATFVQFLCDYPDQHCGGLVSLARKSIAWHRDDGQRQQAALNALGQLSEDTSTRLPPIPLPEEGGVRFLASVGEILEEGERMKHCIGSYTEPAVHGRCYLFHVDYGGTSATVEVGPNGRVRQSFGPRNSQNEATSYGRQVLSRWATGLLISS